jgi:hypothetical protein
MWRAKQVSLSKDEEDQKTVQWTVFPTNEPRIPGSKRRKVASIACSPQGENTADDVPRIQQMLYSLARFAPGIILITLKRIERCDLNRKRIYRWIFMETTLPTIFLALMALLAT